MLEPLTKTRLYEEIVKQFIEKIKKGEFKPGDKIPTERVLALQLNVSRTAIREALRAMELMGVIESKMGSGTFIKEMTLENFLDSNANMISKNERLIVEMLEVRILLETEIAKLAAKRATSENIIAIEKSIDLMEQEIDNGKIGLQGDNSFHHELAIAADNIAMINILSLCSELLDSTRSAALAALKDPKIGLVHHREILEAVRNGKEEDASRLMTKHLLHAYHNVIKKENK